MVGGGDVRAPRRVVDRLSEGPRRDHVAGRARLVLALVGQQRAVVDVAGGVEPVEALDQHRVVDVEPVAGGEPDGLEAEILGARRAAGRDEQLFGEHARTVGQLDHHVLVRAVTPTSASAPMQHVDAGLLERGLHQLAGERLAAGEQPDRAISRVTSDPERGVRGRHLDSRRRRRR